LQLPSKNKQHVKKRSVTCNYHPKTSKMSKNGALHAKFCDPKTSKMSKNGALLAKFYDPKTSKMSKTGALLAKFYHPKTSKLLKKPEHFLQLPSKKQAKYPELA